MNDQLKTTLYSVGVLDLMAIAAFLILALWAVVRCGRRDAILLLAAAILFALRPALIFAFPSHHLVALTGFLPPTAFACLAAYCGLHLVRGGKS